MYRVLIVEDEYIIRKGLVYGFPYEKYDCMVVGEAANGEEGARLIRELQPDIVVTDITMPLRDAFWMLEETIDFAYSTLIVSGYDEFANAQKAFRFGVTEFIVKPIDMALYAEALERAIRQREMQKSFEKQIQQQDQLEHIQLLEEQAFLQEDKVVAEMIRYVERHFGERFVFQDVADVIGYSPTALHARFKKYSSYTFNEYVNRYRIQTAVNRILLGDEKVYEIAESCGFSDYKYFNKVFQKYIGMSASEFSLQLGAVQDFPLK